MPRTFEELAKAQFVRAIKKVFPDPTPLIGDKWFRCHPDGKPADLEFAGVMKLAKATGSSPQKIAAMIVKYLALDKLRAEAHVTKGYRILLRRTSPKDEQK